MKQYKYTTKLRFLVSSQRSELSKKVGGWVPGNICSHIGDASIRTLGKIDTTTDMFYLENVIRKYLQRK